MLKSVCVDSNELNLSFLSNKTNNLGMDVFGLLKPFYIIHGQNYFSTSHATHSLNTDPDVIYIIIVLSQCHSNRRKNKDIKYNEQRRCDE